ncbi:hypothetical protein AAEX28_10535 [Lentisphaerota bacterium WC36G]|nr:hypothetical protein LJT99_13380 [Lentisphaerae bacterium WC36]
MQQISKDNLDIIAEATENCVSIEMLNAFYDGSLSSAKHDQVAMHVQNCMVCQDIIASYDDLDSELNLLLKISDEKIMQSQFNIEQALSKELDLTSKTKNKNWSIPFKTYAFRAAAVLAFAFMGFTIIDMKSDIAARNNSVAVSAIQQNKANEIPKFTKTTTANLSENKFFMQNSVSLDDYQKSSYESKSQIIVNQDLKSKKENAVIIDSSVNHVWTVDSSLESLNNAFATACEDANVTETLDISGDENGFEVTINTTKSKLISLVSILKGRGMKLLSKQAPQPEDTLFYTNGDNLVTYKAQFITSN